MRPLINCEKELDLIKTALDALLSQQNLVNTPIVVFFGINGIGKTRILEEISARCIENDLPCIKVDGKQNISRISSAIVQQTKKYRQKPLKKNTDRKGDSRARTVDAIKILLENKPVVILLDSIDTSNEALVNWIHITLRDLMEHNNLFIVMTSKQKIIFENDWLMARKLTPLQVKPLNHKDSMSYLDSIDGTIAHEIREVIFQWTRGYPLAMEVMTKAILQHHFDIEKSEDQKQLINLIIEEVIDKKVLAHVEPSRLDWYKAHFLLLCIPRRFNLVIMEELLEKFDSPLIRKPQSKLEYMGLPKQLNSNIEILHWDEQKVGFTLDESIRNIFLVYQRVCDFPLFIRINRYLAQKNMEITKEVTGSDSIRYRREYLYHSAQYCDTQTLEAILHSTLQEIKAMSSDVVLQFPEEFTQDKELQEILEKHYKTH